MPVSGDAAYVIYYGFPLSGKSVEKRRLSYIGSSHNGYNTAHKSGAKIPLNQLAGEKAFSGGHPPKFRILLIHGFPEAYQGLLHGYLQLFDGAERIFSVQ